ncbi:MAG: hypothetical protein AB2L12_02515 [Smithellaceae bacterium]
MKKITCAIVLLFFCFAASSITFAEERVVQLKLSGCADCNANARIGAILKKTKGVKKYENKGHGLLIITFNDEIATLNIIINELKRGKLFVESEAIFLK